MSYFLTVLSIICIAYADRPPLHRSQSYTPSTHTVHPPLRYRSSHALLLVLAVIHLLALLSGIGDTRTRFSNWQLVYSSLVLLL
jgi:hypothetical protein